MAFCAIAICLRRAISPASSDESSCDIAKSAILSCEESIQPCPSAGLDFTSFTLRSSSNFWNKCHAASELISSLLSASSLPFIDSMK